MGQQVRYFSYNRNRYFNRFITRIRQIPRDPTNVDNQALQNGESEAKVDDFFSELQGVVEKFGYQIQLVLWKISLQFSKLGII